MADKFVQTSSYAKRLRNILISIAIFFILGMVGLYVSSQGFLNGLQRLNTYNGILNYTSSTLESIGTSEQHLEKAFNSKDIITAEVAFNESLRITSAQLHEAIRHSKDAPETIVTLREAAASLDEFKILTDGLFISFKNFPLPRVKSIKQDLSSELLVANQFLNDTKESLRSVQIKLKTRSDNLFSSIYQNRFLPLLVAAVLSLIFLSFVILVGLSNAKRLTHYLSNLRQATDAVARGDLSYEAPIYQRDEFGHLTFEFNKMVFSLSENQHQLRLAVDRVSRLQSITASLSEAHTPQQVYDVIFQEVFNALGAQTGTLSIVDNEKKEIVPVRVIGFSEELMKRWGNPKLDSPLPLAIAIRETQPVFISSISELRERFPDLVETCLELGIKSYAAVPLIVTGKAVGAIFFSFGFEKRFDQADKEFLMALIRQCSQALHRSQLYAAAREAILVRDEFLSIASHELRTPLTPLKLQLQNLARQMKKGEGNELPREKLLSSVESSNRQVTRLTGLIDDLLDVSRISSGKLNLRREEINLSEMLEEVLYSYTHQLKEAKSQVDSKFDNTLIGFYDKLRIEQVVINLLTNAAKYAPGKQIHMTLEKIASNARITVRDEGNGIPTHDQHRIFDRFERVRDKDNVGGLGLGLYISRQIVEAHQGQIRVDSSPGKGSTFIVDLPL